MKSVWIRRLAIAVGALGLLLVVAVAVLVATFDANRYKTLAIEWMKTEHQRTLAIDGPIELAFFPRLAVKVSKVRLSERGRSDEFAAIGEAALAVRVLPLLRKQLVVGHVSARDVQAAYLRDARGARNIDDLISPNAASGGASPSGGPAPQFDVSEIQLDNLRLHVRDEMAKLAGDFTVLSFSSGRLANQAQSPVSLRVTAQLTQPEAVKLSVDGHMTLMLDLDRNAVALSGMKLDVAGETASVKALSLALEGALSWGGGALRAGPLHLALKGATLGTTSLLPSTLQVKSALLNPADKRLELESLDLVLSGRRGADPFEVGLSWPRLAVDPRKLEGSPLSGRIKIAGQSALEGQIRSAAPTGSFDALRVPELELTLTGSSGQRKIEGSARADMLLDAGRNAATIERLDVHATLADPGLQPLKVVVQGSGHADPKAAAWKLTGSINANRFETGGQAAFAGKVPEIKATARFDDLDMNTLLAADKAAPAAPRSSAPRSPAPADTPVALDGLKAVNGQFTLDAAALAYRQYKVADAKVHATLENGILRVSQLSGRAWGGSFQGGASADANSHRVAVRLDAKGVNVNTLLKNVADKDLLEGTGHVVADLNSSGASVGALRSNLAGTAALDVRDGAVKGINLARSLREAQAALSLKQDALTRASGVEKTDFSELRASARIANGVAQSDDLDLKSPFLRVGGAGRFDIGRGRVDYTARATVTPTAAGQGGAGLEALRGVTVPVALSGPFDAIDWKIQWSGVAEAAVKNKLKEKLAESLGAKLGVAPPGAGAAPAPGKPKDALKDALKGLFK